MPHERQTSLRAVPVALPDDALTELVAMLAGVLRLKPEKIDPEQTFRSLGLDSLLTVEFVATVNARYATAVRAAALFDHPTPLSFARHVARERGMPSPAAPPAPVAPATPLTPRPLHTLQSAPLSQAEPVPPVRHRPVEVPEMPVLDVLREELARILCCDPWDIDATAAFNLLGLDSILGSEFVAVLNRVYGLREPAVTLYDHPSLNALAAHVTALRATAAPMGLEEVLDAVRDGRLSVDDALGLLPRQA
ncbi:acyl carrier protein [Streptomyces sp. NPDC001941]|uniref:acyl carrier protein n=1 Tax=Streptomyces sp. NPDC001941 TaxID=3154659 RepID=UPI0033295CE7